MDPGMQGLSPESNKERISEHCCDTACLLNTKAVALYVSQDPLHPTLQAYIIAWNRLRFLL